MIITPNVNKKISGVYEIVNTINGHRYIGSSVNIVRRFKDHKYKLKCGIHANSHLQNAWKKHGETAFLFSVIEYCEANLVTEREQFYIDTENPKYNKARGVLASMRGYKHSKETVEKNRLSHIGIIQSEESKAKKRAYRHTPEAIQKIIQAGTGRIFTEERKQNIGKSHLGIKATEETKKKLRDSHLGFIMPQETKDKLSEILKGRPGKSPSKETREKISNSLKGNKNCVGRYISEENRRLFSEINKGNKNALGHKMNDEAKHKLIEMHKGKIASEETRKKMSESHKRRIEREHANKSAV
jgi:group I intron endonuclease